MSTLLDQKRFAELFLPDGLWLAIADAAIAGALLVETKPDNLPALALFRKCGYRIIESKPDNVRLEKHRLQR
jgi:ribosomal protein S18 acetylase RimI-like enzyme